MNIEHTVQATSSEYVYNQVKAALIRGENWLNEKFFESHIAERFSVSRTPAREALSRLLVEGLLTRTGRTYNVREFSLLEIRGLYQLREEIECLSVRVACQNCSDKDFQNLCNLISQMDANIDSSDGGHLFSELDQKFHIEIAGLSGNIFLVDSMCSIQDKSALVRSKHLSGLESRKRAQNEHSEILSAFERKLPLVAEAEMRYHIRSSIAAYQKIKVKKT